MIENAVKTCQSVKTDNPVQVFAHDFGESGTDIEVAWWCGATPVEVRTSRSEVVVAIKTALDTADMEIPLPYRQLAFAAPLSLSCNEYDG